VLSLWALAPAIPAVHPFTGLPGRALRKRRRRIAPSSAAEHLTEAQLRMMATTPKCNYRDRSADEIAPLTLPVM
jgi:hypothetical protein